MMCALIAATLLRALVAVVGRERRRARRRNHGVDVVDGVAVGRAFASHARRFVEAKDAAARAAAARAFARDGLGAGSDDDDGVGEAFARGAVSAFEEVGSGDDGAGADADANEAPRTRVRDEADATDATDARSNGRAERGRVAMMKTNTIEHDSSVTSTVPAIPARRPPSPSSSGVTTTSMCEEDRALLREELEVRKLEVSMSYFALVQKFTSNALRAEGNKIAADVHADTKKDREERRNESAVERFHRMTCDALAMGLVTTCATMLSLGRRAISSGYDGWSTGCAASARAAFHGGRVSVFATASYAKCVVAESARGAFGLVMIAFVALMLAKMDITRRFRAAPMFVLALVLFAGVGALGERAVRALGGDPALWLLAWRSYITAIACAVISAPSVVRADGVADSASFRWSFYAVVGVGAPTLVARAAFGAAASDVPMFHTLKSFLSLYLPGREFPKTAGRLYYV